MNHNINKAGKLQGFSSAKKYWDQVNIETINLGKLFDRSSDHK